MAGLPPQQVGVRREGEAAGDAMVEAGAVLQAEEAFGRALAGDEWPVALVDVAGDQLGAFGVGAGDEDGRNAADVGGEPRGIEVADRGLGRDQHLAAEMAALLFGRELVLEVNARGAGLDIGLHDLEAVRAARRSRLRRRRRSARTSRASRRLRDARSGRRAASVLVDLLRELRAGVGGIERLVGIHRAGGVGVGGDLPAGEIDRLEAGADHLHRLVAGDRAERAHGLVLVQQLPQLAARRGGQVYARSGPSRAGAAHPRRCKAARCRRTARCGAATTSPKSRHCPHSPVGLSLQENPSRLVKVAPKRAYVSVT